MSEACCPAPPAPRAMAKKSKGANLQKLGFKALEWIRPVVYYGFIPTVILIGMRTEPRPR